MSYSIIGGRTVRLFIAMTIGGATAGCASPTGSSDEWVLINANVVTVNQAQPRARQIHVRGSRIVAVGDRLDVPSAARRVDAHGRTVLPGLIDAHGHLASQGRVLSPEFVDARGTTSPAEVAALVAQAARTTAEGRWILGRNWDQSNFVGPYRAIYPTHDWLTRAAPNHPVALRRTGGHAVWINREAMNRAGLTRESKNPPGGMILRDAQGEPAGVLVDRAMAAVNAVIPDASVEDTMASLIRAGEHCLSLGLTSVHDAGVGPAGWNAYQRLARQGRLPVRVYAMVSGGNNAFLRSRLAARPVVGAHDHFLTLRAVKLFADGALGSHGAWLLSDYADRPGHQGLPIVTPAKLTDTVNAVASAGFQPCVHAIGDRAVRSVLDAYARVPSSLRPRVEHAQHIHAEDLPRFRAMGVIASIQPTHATSDMRFAARRLGTDRLAGSYAWRSLLGSGAHLAGGSDFPVEPVNPFFGIHAAVTRRDRNGEPHAGWRPEQRLTLDEAIRLFTIDAAYAAFEEDLKGSIEPGKLADFVLLDRDPYAIPPEDLHTLTAERTILGGRVVFRRDGDVRSAPVALRGGADPATAFIGGS